MKENEFIIQLNPSEIESIEYIGEFQTVDIEVDDIHMFMANDIYTHNSGTTQDVLEGSSISNAFSKLFALDFLMTLSRKMKDKISNTARFHVSKNRFGPDGLTFPAKMDTGCGLIEIYHEKSESGEKTKKQMVDDNDYEKQYASKKFNDLMNSQRKEPTDLF